MIRKHHRTHPTQQKQLAEEFTTKTGHLINQSMISEILGKSCDYLDDIYSKQDLQTLKKQSRSFTRDCPELETALFEWQQPIKQKKAIMTGDILKEKAR
jgi:hypothetical protein